MNAPGHPIDRLGDLLDDRLSAAEAAEVREHVAACLECGRELRFLESGRAAAAVARYSDAAPGDLRARVLAALDDVDRATAPADPPRLRRRAVLAGLAAVAALVLYVARPWRRLTSDLVDDARAEYEGVRDGDVALAVRTGAAGDLERYFNDPAEGPRIRVIDLGMMGWILEGGTRRRMGGGSSALYAYRSTRGARLVCQMYPGLLTDLPPADQTRREHAFEFRVYTRTGVSLVYWQEGDLVCVLAADLPVSEVVELAVAKAMAPA